MAEPITTPEKRKPSSRAMTPEKAETLKKLRASVGQLSTTTLRQLEKSLPWYGRLNSDERSALGMVAQNGIAAFVTWYERPSSPSWILSDVFGTAPTELTRSISLQKALQLIRIVVEVVEDQVPVIAPEADQGALREAVLRYSREVAFAAADVYARAAESRGSWDTRLEALTRCAPGSRPWAGKHRSASPSWSGIPPLNQAPATSANCGAPPGASPRTPSWGSRATGSS
jgi:hypothetical protein